MWDVLLLKIIEPAALTRSIAVHRAASCVLIPSASDVKRMSRSRLKIQASRAEPGVKSQSAVEGYAALEVGSEIPSILRQRSEIPTERDPDGGTCGCVSGHLGPMNCEL